MTITTIGLDLAKHWFQVHGVDADGQIVVRRKLRRSEGLAFFQALAPCHDRHGSLCDGAPLGTRADRARAYGEADATGVCEGLRQAQQERRGLGDDEAGEREEHQHRDAANLIRHAGEGKWRGGKVGREVLEQHQRGKQETESTKVSICVCHAGSPPCEAMVLLRTVAFCLHRPGYSESHILP